MGNARRTPSYVIHRLGHCLRAGCVWRHGFGDGAIRREDRGRGDGARRTRGDRINQAIREADSTRIREGHFYDEDDDR